MLERFDISRSNSGRNLQDQARKLATDWTASPARIHLQHPLTLDEHYVECRFMRSSGVDV
jgi:hypothetical protein